MDQEEPALSSSAKNPFAIDHHHQQQQQQQQQQAPPINARSNSITGSSAPGSPTRSFTSFLSRATSVTTSSVTDRLGGAVGSVKSAVGSISSQLQQVPTNIERFSGGVTNSIGQQFAGATNPYSTDINNNATQATQASQLGTSLIGQQMTAPATGGGSTLNPVISRQRILLVIDGYHTEWNKYFKKAYQRSTFSVSGASSQISSSSLFSSFASSSSDSPASSTELSVEQADFREISVLSNSSLSTVPTVYINSNRTNKSSRTVKPDFVLVRQRTKDRLDHFKNIVIGLNYGSIPMLETFDIWQILQDKSWTFSHLASIQQRLGRDQFQLIPQIFCQTHQELVHLINSNTVTYPCLVRLGPSGRGKIKVDNGQMLLELASIVAMNKTICTIEPFIDARCDLLVQKIGQKTIKAYIRKISQINSEHVTLSRRISWNKQQQPNISSGTSVGSSIFATLQSTAGGTFSQAFSQGQQQQQVGNTIKQQPIINYEPVQLSDKYKRWMEAVSEHFQDKGGLEMFSIKALISNKDDKEYIIGMSDSAMDLVSDSLDEDRRAIAELVVSQMSQALKKRSASLVHSGSVRTTMDQQQQHHLPNRVPSLTGRSQSISVGSDTGLTRPQLPRRGSREPAGSCEPPSKDSLMGSASSIGNLAMGGSGDQQGAQPRQSVSSFMDQTQSAAANALSSFQNKSMNFFRRLDSRQESFSSLLGSSVSGSQDKLAGGDLDLFAAAPVATSTSSNQTATTNISPSVVGSSGPPPKPPPPANRPQLSSTKSTSSASDSMFSDSQQSSADIPHNLNLSDSSSMSDRSSNQSMAQTGTIQQNGEPTLDDTMKNLRKTFAGIFGDM